MPEAARVGDDHKCNRHSRGPIIPDCCTSVMIGDMPAAREGDYCECWSIKDQIKKGEPTVLISDMPAARKGDPTDGGRLTSGCATVLIGTPPQAACLAAAAESGAPFVDGGG